MNTLAKKNYPIRFTFIVLFIMPFLGMANSPMDSVGLRKENNKTFIIHKVEQGETVYAIGRRYGVSPSDIMNINKDTKSGLNIGDELKIPYEGSLEAPAQGSIKHKVRSGETLSYIAGRYNVSVSDIKEWNNMRGNTISVGQELTINTSQEVADAYNQNRNVRENNGKKVHIVNKGETLYAISRKYNISTDDIKEWNRLESNDVYIGQELVVGFNADQNLVITNKLDVKPETETEPVKKLDTSEESGTNSESSEEFKKVSERGMARVIDGSETTKKYLALHRSAAIGTIMQVRNEMNDLSVFVRVIGKLPDTDENSNLLIKISKTAYDRLNAYDKQFPVEITYHP